jgi:hypothetical protein
VTDCSGWGILDLTTVGNTYIACNLEGNGHADPTHTILGDYAAESLSQSPAHLFLNCYTEGGLCQIKASRTVIVGNTLAQRNNANDFSPGANSTATLLGNGYAMFTPAVGAVNNLSVDPLLPDVVSANLGSPSGQPRTALEFSTYDSASTPQATSTFHLTYEFSGGRVRPDPTKSGWWELIYGQSHGGSFALSTTKSDLGQGGWIWFEFGFYIGRKFAFDSRIKVDAARSKPAVVGNVGDVVFNSKPRAGGYAGWICVPDPTNAANPNVWKQYGLIEA